jgi:hypothetical protein
MSVCSILQMAEHGSFEIRGRVAVLPWRVPFVARYWLTWVAGRSCQHVEARVSAFPTSTTSLSLRLPLFLDSSRHLLLVTLVLRIPCQLLSKCRDAAAASQSDLCWRLRFGSFQASLLIRDISAASARFRLCSLQNGSNRDHRFFR